MNGLTLYEPEGMTPIFNDPAPIPAFSWKTAPTLGHMKGEARRADNTAFDTVTVTIENLDTQATTTTATDGGGFFGAVDLTPGSYRAQVANLYFCFNVAPGLVANAQLDQLAPETSLIVAPASPNGQNGWYITKPTVTLNANDNCSGVATTEYSLDGGQTWQTYSGTFTINSEGTTTLLYRSTDRAGNIKPQRASLSKLIQAHRCLHSLQSSVIWPADNRSVTVTIAGTG